MDILIRNIDILTMNSGMEYIRNGFIGIRDGEFAFIDSSDENVRSFKADKIIDGKNRLAMPGLINAHTHCAMTPMRNFADDLALEEWLFNRVFPAEAKLTDEDVYWATLLGVAEMIKSGTTAFADMYLHMDSVAQAVMETGIRANLSKSPLRFNVGERSETVDETGDVKRFYREWNKKSEGRILVTLEIHSAYLFNEESLRISAALAKELGTGVQIHVLETVHEREESFKRYGMSSAEICMKTGIFDVPAIAAHCVHCSDTDLEILKQKGVHVAHNPTSNLKLGSGIARIPEMLQRGISVTLGTDGVASNNNLNMFEEMHLAALIHKGLGRNPQLVSAGDAVRMATVNGAKALGFEGRVGSIEKGKRADLILLNTDAPHLCPVNQPLSAVVYAAQASDVETMLVDGEILMENRVLVKLDEERIKAKVRETAKRILS